MNVPVRRIKPWQRLGITKKNYLSQKPWKKAKLSREKYVSILMQVPQDSLTEIKAMAASEVLVEKMFGSGVMGDTDGI